MDMSGYTSNRLARMLEAGIKERHNLEVRFHKLCRAIVHLGEGHSGDACGLGVLGERRKGGGRGGRGGGASTTRDASATANRDRPRSTPNVRGRSTDGASDLGATRYGQTWQVGSGRQGGRSSFCGLFDVEKDHPAASAAEDEARRSLNATRRHRRHMGVEQRRPCGLTIEKAPSFARKDHDERRQNESSREEALSPWRTHFSVADESAKVSVSYEEVDTDLTHEGTRSTAEIPPEPGSSRRGRVGRSSVERGAINRRILSQKRGSGCSESDVGNSERANGQRILAEKNASNIINRTSLGTCRRPLREVQSPRQGGVSASRNERVTTYEPMNNDYPERAPTSPRRARSISVEANRNKGLEVRLRVGDGSSYSESNIVDRRMPAKNHDGAVNNRQGATNHRDVHSSSDLRRSHSCGRGSESGAVPGASRGGRASKRGSRCDGDESLYNVDGCGGRATSLQRRTDHEMSPAGKRTSDMGEDSRKDRRSSSKQMTRVRTKGGDGCRPGASRMGEESGPRGNTARQICRCLDGAVVGEWGEGGKEEEGTGKNRETGRQGRARDSQERQKSRDEQKYNNRHGRPKSLVPETRADSNAIKVKKHRCREGRCRGDDDGLREWTRHERGWRHSEEETAEDDRRWRRRGRVLWSTHAEPVSRASASVWRSHDAVDRPDPLAHPTSHSRQRVRPYQGLYAKSLKANGMDPAFFRASSCTRCCCDCRCVVGKDSCRTARNVPACAQIDDSLLLRSGRAGDHLAAERSRVPVDGLPDRLEAGRVLDSFNRRAEILGFLPPTPLRAKAAWMENPGDPEYRLVESSEGLLSSFCPSSPLRGGRNEQRSVKRTACSNGTRPLAFLATSTTPQSDAGTRRTSYAATKAKKSKRAGRGTDTGAASM